MGELADLGESSRGVWTRNQAVHVTSRGRVDGYVARGEWQAPWPGVYMDAGVPPDPEQRAFAAVLASGGEHDRRRAVVCGRLAARIHGMPLVDDDDPATGGCEHLIDDVAVGWGGVPLTSLLPNGQQRLLLRHRRRYDPEDLLRRPSGVYVTSCSSTVLDCARLLQPQALVCLLDDVLHRQLLSRAELHELVRRRSWQPGVVALREAVALADGRAESPNETLVRLVLKPHLPGLVPQHRLRDDAGRILARFDLGHERLRLAVEADGRAAHAGDRMAARDQRRDRVSDARGWRTERCTWHEARCRQPELVRRMLGAARDQARRHGLT